MRRCWAYNRFGVLMGASWQASCSRWLSLRGNSWPMITLFSSQGRFCATAFNDLTDIPQHRFDALHRWLNEQLPVVFAEVLSEEIKAVCDVRDDRLLGREGQSTLLQERFDHGFDLVLQQFLRCARDDEIIRQADEVDLGTDLFVPVPYITWKCGP